MNPPHHKKKEFIMATFRIAVTGTWTLPASGDTDAVGDFQSILAARLPGVTFLDVSAVVSPVQELPGSTTYDVTAEYLVPVEAASLTASLTRVTLTSLGEAVIKAARVKGSSE